MSSEKEDQILSPSPNEAKASVNSSKTIQCDICEANFDVNHIQFIKCLCLECGKVTCETCTNTMIDLMFAQPILNYPLTCGACSNSFDIIDIDRILVKSNRYEQFISCILPVFWSNGVLKVNERLAQCPFCPYLEIHATDACSVNFLTCQHPSCGKRSCLICLHEIKDDDAELAHQTRCVQYQEYKSMVEKAIETGSKQRCPHCQLTGLKDDGCTHMVCAKCGLAWCYLCGMKEEDCSVEDGVEPSLTAHNNEWEQHEGRCPMSLVSIHELDSRWPQVDQDCLEYFHRYRTLCELFNVFKIIGEDTFNKLNEYYGIIDASGYSIEEIKDYENRILINYGLDNGS